MRGGIIGLVGLQGVGKSSALIMIWTVLAFQKREEIKNETGKLPAEGYDYRVVRFKWLREAELFASLLNGLHPLSGDFRREYAKTLLSQLRSEQAVPYVYEAQVSQAEKHPETLNLKWAAKYLGQGSMRSLRQVAWLSLLRRQENILIDTPDYSRTDRRSMAKDLDEIHRLWNTLSLFTGESPNFVIAIQKELSKGHFFFGRMEMIELDPLTPGQMVESYGKQFKTTWPFTEDSLLAVARMSRGVFRRYLRYITLALDLWERGKEPRKEIDMGMVNQAVTPERIAEDMSLELAEAFPKHSELQKQAANLLVHLGRYRERQQSQLAKELGLEPYSLSRILAKLELQGYVSRERHGLDKIVTITGKAASMPTAKR
jgi:hypothetical protein